MCFNIGHMNNKLFAIVFILLGTFRVFGQDTLRLSVRNADSLFQTNSFYLLAANMHVEAEKAKIIQSKTYPNPVVTAEFNAYDPQNNRAFHTGKTGEKSFQFEQLILLGGKRKTIIDIAKTNQQIAELEFQQLVLDLKNRLHSNLYKIGQQNFLLSKYAHQLNFLDTLLKSYETQGSKGNIALKDVVRLRGAYIQLNNDRAELYQEFLATQSELQILLQTTSIVLPTSKFEFEHYLTPQLLSDLQEKLKSNHPELKIALQNLTLAQQELMLEKRQNVPDINIFTSYDQRGGAFNNQINAGISLPLPLWNRNQGTIKAAEYHIEENNSLVRARELELLTKLNNSYALYTQTVREYLKAKEMYNEDFELTAQGMEKNFKKRNISLIEFIDFFESYNDVIAEMVRIRTQVVISAEQLNLLTATDLY